MKHKGESCITIFGGGIRASVMPSLRLCLLSALALLFVLSACARVQGGEGDIKPSPALDIEGVNYGFTPKPLTHYGRRTPLTISVKEDEGRGYHMSYPYVCDDGMELLNVSIRAVCIDFAREYGGDTGCRLRYNNRGILSFTLFSTDEEGNVTAVSSANFDCDTGTRFFISSCFGSGNEEYRFCLADGITDKLAAKGLKPLSYVPPIDEGRLFYVSEGGLVLLYRKYELCGAEAGFPEVTFRYGELDGLIGPDSILLRLPYFDG